MEQALRFKAMYTRLGFSVADAAKFLQVTPRTVHAWISGRVRIPYAAYKLLRVQLHYELPGDAWSGWSLSAGRLYTPEGHELSPHDFSWWSLLCRKAAMFSALYAESASRAGRAVATTAGHAQACPPAAALAMPPTDGGRSPQATGPNSFLEHFRKWERVADGGLALDASESIAKQEEIPQHEKGACMARKRTRQLGGSGGGTGGRAARLDVAQIQQEEVTKARRAGELPFEGSSLLRGLLTRSVADLAAREWAAVTGGAGVVLVDGRPVDPGAVK
ncbi:VC1465 family Xer recombination activation factor [Hydrogenophaga sp. PBL-H3]|uniref:VC1465 family Xer recombination activation factor n=1 Tax=Hydrogenophaga sp. PBL-H3 TaxID=434010 RepID=UPI0013576E57|nr:VC1465 family Xer recombination activation factor [Hydrogenophaga sp. PBL-H3]